MRGLSLNSVCLFLTVVLAATAASAQEVQPEGDSSLAGDARSALREPSWKVPRGAHEIEIEPGFAPMQPTFFSGRKEYETNGRKLLLSSVRWGRVVGTSRGITFQYLFEAVPLALAFNNEVREPSAAGDLAKPLSRRELTTAFAVQPAGFRFIFLPKKRFKPFVQTSAGFIFSRKPIPIPGSPNYNFVGDFGGGVMFHLTRSEALKFGYRYYHISNMNIGEMNPGYNANVFYVNVSRFLKQY